MAVAQKISTDMLHHADECDAAAKTVNDAASEVESIKAEWSRIQHMADRWGITIDAGSGMLHPPHSTDPDEQAEIEHHMQIIHDAIVDLLRKADTTDQHLSKSVNGAISDMADALGTDSITDPEDARRTVQEALAGNQDSAAQVKSVLDSITPEQRAGKEPLTQQQASVLSQMQAQQNGMSIPELEAAEQSMGASKGAMSDSWQLMSNPNIAFPQTPTVPGASQTGQISKGSFGQLPTSVQNTLTSKGMSQLGDMTKVTNMVKDGNVALRQGGTALDRGMLNKATEMMNSPTFHGQPVPGSKGGTFDVANSGVQTANDVLATAGGDHKAVHDILRDSQYSDNFMKGSLNTDWGDNGKAVGDMFRWTGDAANGPEAKLAAETASAYGSYIGHHEQDLLHMDGHQRLGDLNPEAVRGMAAGLAPFIPDIAETSPELRHDGFGNLDEHDNVESGNLPIAKGIFSVISTDDKASEFFNAQAARDSVAEQNQWAEDYKNHADVSGDNEHLKNSMTLQGLVDAGLHNATDASGMNTDERNAAMFEAKKSAYELAFGSADLILPGSAVVGQGFEQTVLGDAPQDTWKIHAMQDMHPSQDTTQALNALMHAGIQPVGLEEGFIAPPDASHPSGPYVRTYEQYAEWAAAHGGNGSNGHYDQLINSAIHDTVPSGIDGGLAGQLQNMADRYNAVTSDADPQNPTKDTP